MSQYKTNIEINGVEDVPVVVEYEAVEACEGSRDGRGGLKIEPDEPAHISISEVRLVEDGRQITLTTEAESRMEEEINEWLTGMYDQDPPESDDDE